MAAAEMPAHYRAAIATLGRVLVQAGEAGLEVLGGEFRVAIGTAQPPDQVKRMLAAFVRGFARANEQFK